jgi:hypothetical protein
MKLRAEPLCFLSGTMMAESLAASAQSQAQEIAHVPTMPNTGVAIFLN